MIVAFRKRQPGIYATLTRWWTNSPYDHCEIIIKDNMMISAVPKKGVRIIYLLEGLPFKVWDTIEIPTTLEQDHQLHLWASDEIGCKYDWLGMFFCMVLHWGRPHPERWWCSEFCAAALQRVGWLHGKWPYKLSPGDLRRCLPPKV